MRFASDFSLFWLIPWGFIVVFIAIWFYKGKFSWLSEISLTWKRVLIALRATTFFILGVLFIGIIFQAFNYRTEKPILILGVDTSSSMLNYKDSSLIHKQTSELLERAKMQLSDKFDIVAFEIGSNLKALDTLQFYQSQTNLGKSIEQVYADYYNRNLGGVLLVSDGNFNQGSNPIYAASKLTLTPIYSFGVGDTIAKRDHFIKNISVNDVAFINNEFPLIVDIEGNRMGKTSALVTVLLNGQTVASQTVQYDDGVSDFKQVSFLLKASGKGFQQYVVKIQTKDNEYNYQNNERSFYIEVIDSRSKILLLSDAPHPDIAAMKSVWDTDQNLEVVFSTISDWNSDLKNVDLIVVHEAGRQMSVDKRDAILKNQISKLFVIGPNSDRTSTNSLGIGLGIPGSSQIDDIEGSVNGGFQQFEISEDLKRAFNFYPPLKGKFGQFTHANGIDILTYQRIGPVVKKDPQLFFGKTQQYKYGVIYGEGIWRWKITEYAKTESTSSFNELFSKIGQLLLVKQNASPLRVTMPKKFLMNEEVIVNATFLNESLEPITTPTINFQLTDEKGKVSKLQFGAIGKGYKLNVGQLASGKYEWQARTSFNGKSHEKSGYFIVENQEIERLDTKANHNLLHQLAKNSGGKFALLKDYQKSLDELLQRDDLTSVSYQESSFNDLIEYWWILILLILLLGTEWFLRRWLGSY